MFDVVDTAFRYVSLEHWSSANFFENLSKWFVWNLKCRNAVLLNGAELRDNRCHSSGKYFWHCVKIYTCWILTYIVYLPCICMANVIIPTQNKLRNIQKISCKFLFACTQYYFCNAKPIHEIDDTVSSMFMSV